MTEQSEELESDKTRMKWDWLRISLVNVMCPLFSFGRLTRLDDTIYIPLYMIIWRQMWARVDIQADIWPYRFEEVHYSHNGFRTHTSGCQSA